MNSNVPASADGTWTADDSDVTADSGWSASGERILVLPYGQRIAAIPYQQRISADPASTV